MTAALLRPAALFAGFQIGWLSCALGAAAGLGWPGPLAVTLLLTLQITLDPEARALLPLAAIAGVLGLGLDSLLAGAGLIAFGAPWQVLGVSLAPPWLVAIWVLFGATLGEFARLLDGRVGWAVVAGALGGPLSYYAGARLGAIVLLGEPATVLAILAVEWGLLLPILLAGARRFARRPAAMV